MARERHDPGLDALLSGARRAIRIVDVWLARAMKEPRYIRRLAKNQAARSRRLANRTDAQLPGSPAADRHHHRRGDRAQGAIHLAVFVPLRDQRLLSRPPAGGRTPAPRAIGVHASGGAPAGVAAMIDHTLLNRTRRVPDIETLSRGVGVSFSRPCASIRSGSRPARGCCRAARRRVLGRRLSASRDDGDAQAVRTRRAIYDRAIEIDMVINIGALKSGDLRTVERAHRGGRGSLPAMRRRRQSDHRKRRC